MAPQQFSIAAAIIAARALRIMVWHAIKIEASDGLAEALPDGGAFCSLFFFFLDTYSGKAAGPAGKYRTSRFCNLAAAVGLCRHLRLGRAFNYGLVEGACRAAQQ